ncbi:NADH-quinone oxidoreductase subunit A [Geothrix terrae]|uniref:NADH-quinone oxidoreductase subunit A n=1 Tax=Geothrix terrae TaxID=2922720 RepID=UPI001FACB3FC|nr:NADH-quinone oxidoreductase subunit A [Geothrix terrae]
MAHPASPFLPVLILLLVAAVTAIAILFLSGKALALLKPANPQEAKLRPYECGVPIQQPGARHKYSVRFYLTAMLFILFDVEAAFLLPWAVTFKHALWTFAAMLSFMATLLVGFIYAWGKGAFEWEH